MDRRHFIGASALAAAGTLLGRGLAFGQSAFQHLRRGVGIFNGQGGTIGWLVNDGGMLVIDSQNAASAAACIEGLGAGASRSIDFLVNTHHHGDHVGGNRTFQPVVGSIVAHENSASWQRRVAEEAGTGASQAYPDRTFRDEWRETVGDETVVARYYGAGHTSGDVTVTFERANVVHMGDLMFNRLHPFVDRSSGASIRSWIGTLRRVAEEHGSDTLYVFGHGSAGVTGDGSEL
ncbi:MAG TPA: MBL fold metallo-hydrolase, partial [Longimicrobiales bacterium]|nr:MBL fold metallo-hydrolase [Longimicrobiales bacterium]